MPAVSGSLLSTTAALKTFTVCHTPALLRAAAPNLFPDSEALARSGNLAAAIQGFTTAQQWDPRIPRFDPGDRARSLAKAAQSKQR